MTAQERVQAVGSLGFTDRQARFLVTVALHSGYCLRRHYETFAGIRYGKNVRAFLDGLVARDVGARFGGRADRGHIYHLHGRSLYAVMGEEGHRHRRPASPAQIARRLMLLDVAIGRRAVTWFTTDAEKIALFTEEFHVPTHALPRRALTAPTGEGTDQGRTRYFPHHLPIFLSDDGVPHFVYLATDASADAFSTFLRDHALLLQSLSRWAVLAVGTTRWPGLSPVFQAFTASLPAAVAGADDELQWYFERRRLVDTGDLAQVSVFDLRRFRTLRKRFDSAAHERLYTEWLTTGRTAAAPGSPTGDSTGTLITEVLPFAYEQFGSLPGVA